MVAKKVKRSKAMKEAFEQVYRGPLLTDEELRAILTRCTNGYVPESQWERIKSVAKKLRAYFGETT